MANTVPSTSAEAIRDVLLANNYHQSLELERWDSTEEWRTDHQFFLTGPSQPLPVQLRGGGVIVVPFFLTGPLQKFALARLHQDPEQRGGVEKGLGRCPWVKSW